MRAKGQLEITARVIDVLRARRSAAEAALISARAEEHAARQEEQVARDNSRAAQDDWLNYLSKPGFSPEQSRSLSLRLIDRDNEVDTASLRTSIMMDTHVRRQADWQLLEAQTRSSRISLRELERKASRRREEDRLNRLADLTTYAWSRP